MANTYTAQTADGSILFTAISVQRACDAVTAYLAHDLMGDDATVEDAQASVYVSLDSGETWEESEDPVSMVKPALRGKSGSSVMFCYDPSLTVVRLTFLLTI